MQVERSTKQTCLILLPKCSLTSLFEAKIKKNFDKNRTFASCACTTTLKTRKMKYQDAALVCFSGGQDSTTCLFWAKKHFKQVETVCFSYGQKHSAEIEIARRIAADANVPFQVLGEIYSFEKALEEGTLFPELNLPMEIYVPRQRGV